MEARDILIRPIVTEKSLKFGTVVADASDKYQSTENGLTEG